MANFQWPIVPNASRIVENRTRSGGVQLEEGKQFDQSMFFNFAIGSPYLDFSGSLTESMMFTAENGSEEKRHNPC